MAMGPYNEELKKMSGPAQAALTKARMRQERTQTVKEKEKKEEPEGRVGAHVVQRAFWQACMRKKPGRLRKPRQLQQTQQPRLPRRRLSKSFTTRKIDLRRGCGGPGSRLLHLYPPWNGVVAVMIHIRRLMGPLYILLRRRMIHPKKMKRKRWRLTLSPRNSRLSWMP